MRAFLIIFACFFTLNIANARTILAANTTFYADTVTGTDTPGCGAVGTPCKTPQYIFYAVQTGYDLAGFNLTISCAACNDTTGVKIAGPFVGQTDTNTITLLGNSASPTSAKITTTCVGTCINAVSATSGARILVDGFSVGTVNGGSCLFVDGASEMNVQNVDYRSCAIMNFAHVGGRLIVVGNISVSGDATYFSDSAGTGAWFRLTYGITVSINGNRTFTTFMYSTEGGLSNAAGITWNYVGGATVTGKKCQADFAGIIGTNGGLANIPGNVACTSGSGTWQLG